MEKAPTAQNLCEAILCSKNEMVESGSGKGRVATLRHIIKD